jgi:transposase
MRTKAKLQRAMWSYVSDEDRIPADHPLRAMRAIVDPILQELSPQFDSLYVAGGRASVPPEYLLRALLLQMLYTIRSERQLVEQLHYNILYRWFVGLRMDDEVWHATTFSKNRERLIKGDIARRFFDAVVAHAQAKKLMSNEHFTVDGTIIEAAASLKSVRPRDEPPDPPAGGSRNEAVDFHGETRTNATHVSTTDPDARLYRKSSNTGAKLSYLGHVTTENRNGLIAQARTTSASGFGERAAAASMIASLPKSGKKMTLGADKGYDNKGFVEIVESFGLQAHIAQHSKGRTSSIPDDVTATADYLMSQRRRKLVEETFGWMKSFGLLRKLRHRGRRKVDWIFTMTAAAYNLIRIVNLTAAAA